ncbi:MAG: flagellin [Pseudomonadota bacterium]
MGLNIISNFAANRALTNLNESSGAASLSVAKLSSGSRIVTAADDAASLAIGSRLRAEVASLEQAVVNAGQATSLLQIADGALGTTQDILTRLRALSVQAGSENLADFERQLLDVEFQNLVAEIDRIAADTEFNGQKLLSNQNGQFVPATSTGLFSEDGQSVQNVTFRNFNNDAVASGGDGSFDVEISFGTVADTALDPVYVAQIAVTAEGGGQGSFSQQIDKGLTDFEGVAGTADLSTGTTLLFTDLSVTAGTFNELTEENAEIVLSLGQEFNVGLAAFQAAPIASGVASVNANANANEADFRANQAAGDYVFKVGSGILPEDTVELSLFGSTVENLGLSNLDVTTRFNADAANQAVEQAIDFVTSARAQAGSAFSRIEFAEQNLRTTIDNTEAARSTLLDLDVAREITNFTSQQILVQAGISVLAQANQIPQNLLRLFA